MREKFQIIFDKLFKDKDGKIVLGQMPNAPIIGWALFRFASVFIKDPAINHGFQLTAQAFLFVWAYLEVTQGVNYLRRILGGVVLFFIIIGFFGR